MKPVLHEAFQRLSLRIGTENAVKFRGLLYRIVLGLNESAHEYYGELRRLKPGSDHYEAAHLYRSLLSENPQASRITRAAYAWMVKGTKWFKDMKEACEYYMVSVEDLQEVFDYWTSVGSPSLARKLKPTDVRSVDNQVTLANVQASPAQSKLLSKIAWSFLRQDSYRYLYEQGYTDSTELHNAVWARGLTVWMTTDYMDEHERLAYSKRAMNTYLIDTAKSHTAKCRTRAIREVDDDGVASYATQVFNIEGLAAARDSEGGAHDPWETVTAEGFGTGLSHEKHNKELQMVMENLEDDPNFSEDELRIVKAILCGEEDDEISELMEGFDPNEYMEFLCTKLSVPFAPLCNKLLGKFGMDMRVGPNHTTY